MVTLVAQSSVNTVAIENTDFGTLILNLQPWGSYQLDAGYSANSFTIEYPLFVQLKFDGANFSYGLVDPVTVWPTGGVVHTLTSTGVTAYTITGLNLDLAAINANPNLLNSLFKYATMIGSSDADFLDGSGGHDTINGAGGADTITGGPGDVLTGGGTGDGDQFVFGRNFGKNIITDFQAGDTIQLPHSMFHNFAAVKAHEHVDSHHHLVIAEGTSSITFLTLHHARSLTHGEVMFA
jgi:RTX calcium-binding nonapeptide repeat (4 copies)